MDVKNSGLFFGITFIIQATLENEQNKKVLYNSKLFL